jgi:hypothetical protein
MALGSTQLLIEMSTRNLHVCEALAGKAVDLDYICENVGASTSHNPMELHGLLEEITLLYLNYFT